MQSVKQSDGSVIEKLFFPEPKETTEQLHQRMLKDYHNRFDPSTTELTLR